VSKIEKKPRGTYSLPFLKKFGQIFFVEFLTIDGWILLKVTKNYYYRRLLLFLSILRPKNEI